MSSTDIYIGILHYYIFLVDPILINNWSLRNIMSYGWMSLMSITTGLYVNNEVATNIHYLKSLSNHFVSLRGMLSFANSAKFLFYINN
jgi:hypothetical protein